MCATLYSVSASVCVYTFQWPHHHLCKPCSYFVFLYLCQCCLLLCCVDSMFIIHIHASDFYKIHCQQGPPLNLKVNMVSISHRAIYILILTTVRCCGESYCWSNIYVFLSPPGNFGLFKTELHPCTIRTTDSSLKPSSVLAWKVHGNHIFMFSLDVLSWIFLTRCWGSFITGQEQIGIRRSSLNSGAVLRGGVKKIWSRQTDSVWQTRVIREMHAENLNWDALRTIWLYNIC